MELLDDAIRMVAALDEPDELNFIRKHVRQSAGRLGISEEDAATRIFSNAPGAYGANVDMMVGSSKWETRDDLADLFLRRKTFAYGRRKAGRDERALFEDLSTGIDTTFQNLDSSEIGITDVDHYFEYLGGLTAVVERSRGTRPVALVADTTTARGKVRTLEETIRLEARTKLLNPKWSEGMLAHGYQGVEEIRKRLDYTFGFSATADAVPSWVYQLSFETYCDDLAMRDRMRALNVYSYGGMVRRLLEAERRGYWKPSGDALERLRELDESLEDQAEGVIGHG
jgi:magnesium chelatase subunit H